MLTIRLQRTGTKNAASFRLVVAEKSAHVSKKFTEVLGHYNPRNKDFSIKNTERLNYWLSHNIALSPTVNNLLVTKGLKPDGEKVKAFNIPKKEVVAEPVVAEAPVETPAPAAEAAPAVVEESAPAAEVAPVVEEAIAEPTPEAPSEEVKE